MIKIVAAAVILGLALAEDGPSSPLSPYTADDCQPGIMIVDQQNMCWYHQCLMISATEYSLLARRCPLGTKVPYDYTKSLFNPCTERFTGDFDFECSRQEETVQQVPQCASEMVCYNGGTLLYEGSTCWCQCPVDWQGDWLCNYPTGFYQGLVAGSDICLGGQPEQDWCAEVGGCLNGGACYNQCDSYWCDCPTPFTWSKRCDAFSCSDDNECYNGGVCDRGDNGNSEYRTCSCPSGYSGYQCEYSN